MSEQIAENANYAAGGIFLYSTRTRWPLNWLFIRAVCFVRDNIATFMNFQTDLELGPFHPF